MNVKLTGYSQDIDLDDPKKAISYLNFRLDDGKEVRVKVGDETIMDLVMKLETSKSVNGYSVGARTMVLDEDPVVQDDDGVRSI